jgi:hypothetical protein
MTRRISVGVAWLATVVGAILLVVTSQIVFVDQTGAGWTLVFVSLAFDVVAFGSVGAILALRRPGNVIGLVLIVAGLLIVQTFLGFILGAVIPGAGNAGSTLAGLLGLVGGLGITPTLIVAGPLLAVLFPEGHLPGPRWRWPVGAIAGMLALSTLLTLVRPGPINEGLATNPLGITGVAWLEAVTPVGGTLGSIALLASLALALAAVVTRYRRSASERREQLKWFVAANALVAIFLSLSLADGATDPTAFDVLGVASLSLPPIAVGIAILRYRLYEIDRLISRTLSYSGVTITLALVFVAGVLGLQAVLDPLTGGNTVAVAASTLIVAALFQPLRRRVQRIVDRRFNRARYDALLTVDGFARRLRDEVDLDRLRTLLVATADDVVRPVSASVWLRSGR